MAPLIEVERRAAKYVLSTSLVKMSVNASSDKKTPAAQSERNKMRYEARLQKKKIPKIFFSIKTFLARKKFSRDQNFNWF